MSVLCHCRNMTVTYCDMEKAYLLYATVEARRHRQLRRGRLTNEIQCAPFVYIPLTINLTKEVYASSGLEVLTNTVPSFYRLFDNQGPPSVSPD